MVNDHTKNEFDNYEKFLKGQFLCDKKYMKITLYDKYCPIFEGTHESESSCYRYFAITDRGYGFMRCTNEKCIDRISPEKGIKVPKRDLKQIFPD